MKIPFCPKHVAAIVVAASVAFAFTGCESTSSKKVSHESVPAHQTNFSGEYLLLKDLDVQPRVSGRRAEPMYPFELKKSGVSGEAIIEFIVNVNGNVEQAQIQKATHKAFGQSALAAVMQWKFKPGMKGGVPVNTLMKIPVAFDVNRI